MRLSIVTPSYNQGQYIAQTLDSILDQPKGLDLEYIIMDGGSTDSTADVVESYRQRFFDRGIRFQFISERDRGQSDAINKGSRLATGELLTYLNSDDFYQPGVLDHVVRAFEQHPTVQWGYGGWRFIDEEGRLYSVVQPRVYRRWQLRCLDTIAQPSCFYRREFFFRAGAINEDLHLSMDYDLWLRMARLGDPLVIPHPISNLRYYAATKSGSKTGAALRETLQVQGWYTRSPLVRAMQYFYFLRGAAVVGLRRDITRRILRMRKRALAHEQGTTGTNASVK